MFGNSSDLTFLLKMKDEASKVMRGFGREVLGVGRDAQKTADDVRKLEQTFRSLDNVARDVTRRVIGLAAAYSGAQGLSRSLQDAVKQAGDLEHALVGVQKTTNLSSADTARLGERLQALSTKIPVSAAALAGAAKAAGQNNVQGVDNLSAFAESLAALESASDGILKMEDAADVISKLQNLMGLGRETVSNFASALAYTADTAAGNEWKIAKYAENLGKALSAFKVKPSELFALAGAFSDTAQEYESASTAIQYIMIEMSKAVAQGGKPLQEWAAYLGITADEFERLQKESPVDLLVKMMGVLKGMVEEYQDWSTVLDKFKVGQVETIKAMLPLAAKIDLVTSKLEGSSKAYADGNVHMKQAEAAYTTYNNMVITTGNVLDALKERVGRQLIGALKDSMTAMQEWGRSGSAVFGARSLGEDLSAGLSGALQLIADVGADIKSAFSDSGVVVLGTQIRSVLIEAMSAFGNAVRAVSGALTTLGSNPAFLTLAQSVLAVVNGALTLLNIALKAVADNSKLAAVAVAALAAPAVLSVLTAVARAVFAVETAILALIPASRAAATAVVASARAAMAGIGPVGWAALGLSAAVGGYEFLSDSSMFDSMFGSSGEDEDTEADRAAQVKDLEFGLGVNTGAGVPAVGAGSGAGGGPAGSGRNPAVDLFGVSLKANEDDLQRQAAQRKALRAAFERGGKGAYEAELDKQYADDLISKYRKALPDRELSEEEVLKAIGSTRDALEARSRSLRADEKALNSLTSASGGARAESANMSKAMRDEIAMLRMTADEREVYQKVLEAEEILRSEGKRLTDEQRQALTEEVRALQDARKEAEALKTIEDGRRSLEVQRESLKYAKEGSRTRAEAIASLQIEQQLRQNLVKLTAAQRAEMVRQAGLAVEITEAMRLRESLRTPREIYDVSTKSYQSMKASGFLSDDEVSKLTQSAYRSMLDGSKDWESGVERGWLRFRDTVADAATTAQRAFEGAMSGMEDAFVSFVTKGEISFSKFTDAILADMARMVFRQTVSGLMGDPSSGTGLLGSIFGGVSRLFGSGVVSAGAETLSTGAGAFNSFGLYHGGGRAGSPSATRLAPAWLLNGAPRLHSGTSPWLRGDEYPAILQRGEEVLTARQQSELAAASRSANFTINVNVTSGGSGDNKASNADLAALIGRRVKEEVEGVMRSTILNERRPGGVLHGYS